MWKSLTQLSFSKPLANEEYGAPWSGQHDIHDSIINFRVFYRWESQRLHQRLKCLSFISHWGRVTHICVGNITIIGSNNGLSPGRRQATIWTNAGILLIGPLQTNVSEILNEIHTFSFKKMHLKTSSRKRRPFCLGLNVILMGSNHWCFDELPLTWMSCENLVQEDIWRLFWHRGLLFEV